MKKFAPPLLALLVSCGNPTTPPVPTPTPPVPTPTPTTVCPIPPGPCKFKEWKIGKRECADVAYGGSCLMDTTPMPRCNAESSEGCPPNSCGRRRECEPFHGPNFRVEGAKPISPNQECGVAETCWKLNDDNDYQIRLIHVRGTIRVWAEWPPGVLDQHGEPIDLTDAKPGFVVVKPTETP